MNHKGVLLIVDDDKKATLPVKAFLASEGYDVLMSSDINDAIVLIDSLTIDVVLLDIEMATQDEKRILKHIRTTKPKIKIIVTVPRNEDLRKKIRAEDMDMWLYKPVEMAELAESIKDVLGASKKGGKPMPNKKILIVDDDPKVTA